MMLTFIKEVDQFCNVYDLKLGPIISDQPWSTVWNATQNDGVNVIVKRRKVIPDGHPTIIPQVASVLNGSVPKVIACDPASGLFVFEYVQPLDETTPSITKSELLKSYAICQGRAYHDLTQLTEVPTFDPLSCFQDVQKMIAQADGPGQLAEDGNVFCLMPRSVRDTFGKHLDQVSKPFLKNIQEIAELPKTLEHTDLRFDNCIKRDDGSIMIIDWDDAVIAQPGLSLHTQFSGASRVAATLLRPNAYASKAMASKDAQNLNDYIEQLSGDIGYQIKDFNRMLPLMAAMGVLKYVVDMKPYDLSDPALGPIVAREVEKKFNDLIIAFKIMFPRQQSNLAAKAKSASEDIETKYHQAMPQADGTTSHLDAVQIFKDNGALLLREAFDPAFIRACFTEFTSNSATIMSDIQHGAALRVGDRRYMLSIDTNGTMGTPALLASEPLMNILYSLIGENCILGSLTSVLALGQSSAQSWHRDNDPLFADVPDMDLPATSIAVLIPLVPLNDRNGATEIVLKSHKPPFNDGDESDVVRPTLDLGDCYLMDSRVMHRGMANLTEVARPVLSLVYQREWYKDVQNFKIQSALTIGQQAVAGFPEDRQHLVSWAVHQ